MDAAFGASLSPRAWARIGLLVAADGDWGEESVLPDDAVEAVLEGSGVAPEYGLGLWRNLAEEGTQRAFYPGGLPDLAAAAGAGNQRLFVLPSLDLVVVRFGGPNQSWRDREFLGCLVEPAPDQASEPLPGNSPSG